MSKAFILTNLCATEFKPGDSAQLVAWADGQFGIARNGQPVGEQRWQRSDLSDCARAFLNYVRIIRRKVAVATECQPAGRAIA